MSREYLVVVEKGKSGYGAHVPDLPGCVAVAQTRREVLKLIREGGWRCAGAGLHCGAAGLGQFLGGARARVHGRGAHERNTLVMRQADCRATLMRP